MVDLSETNETGRIRGSCSGGNAGFHPDGGGSISNSDRTGGIEIDGAQGGETWEITLVPMASEE